jgi:hypothetical protein
MTLSLTCKHCDEVLTGDDEDGLVARVQTHVRGHARDYGRGHAVSREQILARLHSQRPEEKPPTGTAGRS